MQYIKKSSIVLDYRLYLYLTMDLRLIFNDLRDEKIADCYWKEAQHTFQPILSTIPQTVVERKYSGLTITQTQ